MPALGKSALGQADVLVREAVERTSGPEQLNSLVQVTRPISWVALVAAASIAVITVLWGFLGTLPLTVQGPGMLMEPGGLHGVFNLSAGQIVSLLVRRGDRIKQGQHVAVIQSADNYPQVSWVEVSSPLAGEVAQVTVSEGEFVQAGSRLLNLAGEPDPRDPLFQLELHAVLYLPVNEGKKVRPGMLVRMAVATAQEAEYGELPGKVLTVGDYSLTPGDLMKEVGNENLVKFFTSGEAYQLAPIRVRVALIPDSSTPSGYSWTSRRGPRLSLTPGTVVRGSVVVEGQRPVDLLVPYLSKRLGARSEW